MSTSAEDRSETPPSTLGDVLYASIAGPLMFEQDWVRLLKSVARGDQGALGALYQHTNRAVFTLLVRMTCSREIAEELALEVYREVRRKAVRYRAEGTTVVAWIMNRARSLAIERLRRDQRKNPGEPASHRSLITIEMPDYRDIVKLREQGQVLRAALAGLDGDERRAIETVYFGGMTCGEAAARLDWPVALVKTRLGGGMHKLGRALAPGAASGDSSGQCAEAALVCAHALHALSETEAGLAEAHLSECSPCRRKLEGLRPVVEAFVSWPTDLLRPACSLRENLHRAAGGERPQVRVERRLAEREWETVAPGIACNVLTHDTERHLVSMLVRLAPGGEYPPHTHAAFEELHLLDGELWIHDRRLYPGDYNIAEPGTRDRRVWSETGCTCVLTTSTRDALT